MLHEAFNFTNVNNVYFIKDLLCQIWLKSTLLFQRRVLLVCMFQGIFTHKEASSFEMRCCKFRPLYSTFICHWALRIYILYVTMVAYSAITCQITISTCQIFYVDLLVIYVDVSDHYVDLSEKTPSQLVSYYLDFIACYISQLILLVGLISDKST